MRIAVRVDNSQLILKLRDGERRLAYAVANGINKTLLEAQRQERRNVHRRMQVRRTQFVERQAAVIKPFANARQGRPYGEIAVGQRPRLLLSVFERGGVRLPFRGRRVAVPVTGGPARPKFSSSVPAEWQFRQLHLRKTRPGRGTTPSGKQRRQRGGKGVRFGERRTYMLPEVGVFQRLGEGKSRLVYVFVKPPRLRARLRFEATVRRTADRWFAEYMDREKGEALRRAGFR